MTAVDDLIKWLREQIDEDERLAQAATPGPWRWVNPGGKVKQALVADGYPWQMILPSAAGDVYPQVSDAEHIIRHDPVRTLREVKSKRLILDEIDEHWDDANPIGHRGSMFLPEAWDRLLRLLALPYDARPGYREEWRP